MEVGGQESDDLDKCLIFRLILPIYDTAVRIEVSPATTLIPMRQEFDDPALFVVSEKRDNVCFGFIECDVYGPLAHREEITSKLSAHFNNNQRPPPSFFELAEISDRMSALLSTVFPGKPHRKFQEVKPEQNRSVPTNLAFREAEIRTLEQYSDNKP